MNTVINSMKNNALAALSSRAPAGVLQAIKGAAAKTGVNFAYMVQQAAAESSFNPAAKAKTSSASGLYQFIESTWMSMVEKYGSKHGLDTEGKSKREILDMRNDANVASLMAAEFAGENEKFLDSHWARGEKDIGSTELYFAHFLGAPKAAAFLSARDEDPQAPAAVLFPKAAKANRNVFYDTKTGRMKSLDEVYAFFDRKFDIEGDGGQPQIAEAEKPVPTPARRPAYASSVFINSGYPKVAGGGFTRSYAPLPYQSLVNNPVELMLLSQLDLPTGNKDKNAF